MSMVKGIILMSIFTCCWTQTPTHYTMQTSSLMVLESQGTTEVCILRTGDFINTEEFVFLTTEDDSAVGDEDFNALDDYAFKFDPNEKEKCLSIVINDDDAAEFKEKFKVTIKRATDGIPGSQASTEITIEENDHCTEVPVTSISLVPFYVTPWQPEPGKAIIFKNTLQANNYLGFILSSSSNSLDNSYQLAFEDGPGSGAPGTFKIFKNGVESATPIPGVDIVQGGDTDIINITYDQSSGTVRVTYSSDPSDQLIFVDDTGSTPLTIRHVFAFVDDADASGIFTLCGDGPLVLPIRLPRLDAQLSVTSNTYPNAVALRAIDGDRASTVEGSGTCSVSENVEDPWWRLDLGQEHDVFAVNIFPVDDADTTGLDDDDIAGAQVYIGSCNETYIEQLALCGTAPENIIGEGPVGERFPTYVECTSAHTYGRYVYIRVDTDESVRKTLSLCEIEVYGTQIPFGSETTVSFSNAMDSVAEGASSIPVTVEMIGPGSSCTSIDLYSEDDTATSFGTGPGQIDFTAIPKATPQTIMFNPMTRIQVIDVPIYADTMCEENESFKLILSNILAGVLETPAETTITISDDDTTRYSIQDATVGFEIQEGEEPLEVSILRQGTADIINAEGVLLFKSEEEDNESTKSVMFAPEKTLATVSVELKDDNVYEDEKKFAIRLEPTEDCDSLLTGEDRAIVTVKDDDSRFFFDDDNLSNNVISVPESAVTYQIKLRREGKMRAKTVDISVQHSRGDYKNAQHGEDFIISENSVSFKSGEDDASVTLRIENDFLREGDESFDLVLSDPEDIIENIKEPFRITIVIVDDDAIYGFKPDYYSVSESEQSVRVCVQRSGALTRETSIKLVTQDVTTTVGRDYNVPRSGLEVMFFEDSKEACTSISIIGDSVAEQTETILVHIASNDVEKEFNTRATVNIHDDPDVFISFSSNEYFVNEGEEKVTVYLSKDGDVRQSVSVRITSSLITAESEDFVSVTDGVRISSGLAMVAYEVPIIDDDDDESNEQFRLTLSQPSAGSSISNADTVITIIDDDHNTGNPDTGDPVRVITGGILAWIIVGVTVTTIVTALGVALFCAYLLRRPSTPAITSSPPPLPLATSGIGDARGLPYGQSFKFGGPPRAYYYS